MDRRPHRWALPEDVEELPEASPDDVRALDEADELPEASPDDVCALDEADDVCALDEADELPAPAVYVSTSAKRTFPLRLGADERKAGKDAAARMPPASLSPWDRRPWTEADWWRRVGVDWAAYVNALPEDEEGALPSRVVKTLRQRIAQLERRPGGVELEATPAVLAGESRVSQCAQCGLLVCTTSLSPTKVLGACPACDGDDWWEQTLPVGPFKRFRGAARDAAPAVRHGGAVTTHRARKPRARS